MSYLRALGSYVPKRIVGNVELGALLGAEPDWMLRVSGIAERRFAAPEESVASLGIRAAEDCLAAAGVPAAAIGLVLVSSGSSERRFPGPASAIVSGLGIPGIPAIDLPVASAGSLFALSLASQLTATYGNVLVVASELLSRTLDLTPAGRDTALLFGDGAGACLVSKDSGFARIADSLLASDGEFSSALRFELSGPIQMEGRTIILQASRKIPRAIADLLERNQVAASSVDAFIMHQANLNLITRVAQAVGVPEDRFVRNLERYGNTSSASMLIAAAEWRRAQSGPLATALVFAAFGAGLHWGALLAMSVE
jgi:3-oxoacyl-[acyl-carrier-protein] synthase-3